MTSKLTINLVVGILGFVAIAVVIGGIILTLDGKTIPDALIAIGSGAVGSVGTLLARTGTDPVQTTNIVARNVDSSDPALD